MTNNVTRCPYYEQESANVKSRWACIVSNEEINDNVGQKNRLIIPNNKEDCLVSFSTVVLYKFL